MVKWVKGKKYTELTGETIDACRSRLNRGIWQAGKHMKKMDGLWWFNIWEIDQWRDGLKAQA